jgi:hypothetical protein
MLDIRVRECGEDRPARAVRWLKGEAKFGIVSRLCHLDWSQLSLSQGLGFARGRGFTPSITIGRPPLSLASLPLLHIPAPSEAFSCLRRCASVHILASGNAERLSLCSVRSVFINCECCIRIVSPHRRSDIASRFCSLKTNICGSFETFFYFSQIS